MDQFNSYIFTFYESKKSFNKNKKVSIKPKLALLFMNRATWPKKSSRKQNESLVVSGLNRIEKGTNGTFVKLQTLK
jgi:hypothetical protein